jgi:hypothetical protein
LNNASKGTATSHSHLNSPTNFSDSVVHKTIGSSSFVVWGAHQFYSPKQPHGKYGNNNYNISRSKNEDEFDSKNNTMVRISLHANEGNERKLRETTYPASSLFSFPTPLAPWTIPINTTANTR